YDRRLLMILSDGLSAQSKDLVEDFFSSIRYLKNKKDVLLLVFIASILTFFVGFIENLSSPYILSFASSEN
ncbi:hypothetical protein, partial [Rhodovulum adriaticum]|uniref:hypothetical protein n=1 Tax=Rhodovulum adriaticum TaxID=35804 RepID=UPI001A92CD78